MNKKIASIVLAGSLLAPQAMPLDQTNQNPSLGKRIKSSIPPHVKKYLPAQSTVNGTVLGAVVSTLMTVMINHRIGNSLWNKMLPTSAFGTAIFALLGYCYDVIDNPDAMCNLVENDLLTIIIKFMRQHPEGTSVDYWEAHHSDIEEFICNHTGKSTSDERYREFGTNLKNAAKKLDVIAKELLTLLNDWRNEEHHIECYSSLYYDVRLNNELLKKKLLSLADYLESTEKFDAEHK